MRLKRIPDELRQTYRARQEELPLAPELTLSLCKFSHCWFAHKQKQCLQ